MKLSSEGLSKLSSQSARLLLLEVEDAERAGLTGKSTLATHLVKGSSEEDCKKLIKLRAVDAKFKKKLVTAVQVYRDALKLPVSDTPAQTLLKYCEPEQRDAFNACKDFFTWDKKQTEAIAKSINRQASAKDIAAIKQLFTTANDLTDASHPLVAQLNQRQKTGSKLSRLFSHRKPAYSQLPTDDSHEPSPPPLANK